MTREAQIVGCRCGEVVLELAGDAIVRADCFCADCQQAANRLAVLPGAPPLVDAQGATPFFLYRKDRIAWRQGQGQLREYRLSPGAGTRRVVAACCNTPVFLELINGHWLSLYGVLWPAGTLPPPQIRTMTRDRPAGIAFDDDIPSPATQNVAFYAKLFAAWAAMGFRAPRVDVVQGELRLP